MGVRILVELTSRLDLFKAMAAELATSQQTAEAPSLSLSLPANLGPTWIQGFPGRHPEFRAKFAVLQDYQRLHASHPTPIRDYFNKLGAVLRKYNFQPHNMYNMDKNGFLLGVHNQAKDIVRHRHHPPIEKMDGSREWITVVECTCADNSTTSPGNLQGQRTIPRLVYGSWRSECEVCTL